MTMTETFTVLALSTAHVTEEIAQRLNDEVEHSPADSPVNLVSWDPFRFGWWVYVNDDAGMWESFPQCLQDCFALARQTGARYIQFDRDVEPIDALPIYEW